ncbi:ABC transporter permease [Rhodanobacter glycinis]|uniref:Transport permease protein n=1 Tax=Rhodanobacter glycinis TaxID=582702 RepID=A0A1I4D7V9_9GAMM|nr:ABC transporter permease [Rhodanobacter glycinis]SFK88226.1 lipopolysaccharide transport system permease protein [Rhodanobacter glycinis]
MLSNYRLRDPLSPYRALTRHLALTVQMAKRDVVGRYRGSFIGLMWAFFNPLLMLGVYTFVFGVLFKSRWSAQSSGHLEYAVILFAGLNINSLFAECANRAPSLIIENANFVKKVVFPLETLSWSLLGSALFHLLVSTVVLLVFLLVVKGAIPWTAVLFPIVVLPFIPFMIGLIWLLGSLGVFLRDLKQAITVITPMMMFLAPIFYSKELISPRFRDLLYLNPLTLIVEASRDVLVWGRLPAWGMLGLYTLISCLFAWAAFSWFERTRRGFADVL